LPRLQVQIGKTREDGDGRAAKYAHSPITAASDSRHPSRQQEIRFKKMFGKLADSADLPNIFSKYDPIPPGGHKALPNVMTKGYAFSIV